MVLDAMKRIWIFFSALGVLSLLVLALPELGMIAAITFIGLPLAAVYWAIPAVFLITALSYPIYRAMPVKGKTGMAASVLGALVCLAVLAQLLNRGIHSDAQSYAGDDHNNLVLPISAETIAVRTNGRPRHNRESYTLCDGFCLHALLTGSAKRITMALTKNMHAEIDPAMQGMQYWIEKRDKCPTVNFRSGGHELEIRTVRERGERVRSAVEFMKFRMSEGQCLVSRKARIDESDIIISHGKLKRPDYSRRHDGFSFTGSTVNADRITVHTINKNDRSITEHYRWTGIRYQPFLPVFLPGPIIGNGFDVNMGWLRGSQRLNIKEKYYERPDWPGFLTDTLGLDLTFKSEGTKSDIVNRIKEIADQIRPATEDEWKLVADYFERSGLGAGTKLDQQDFEIAMRFLANPEYPPIPRVNAIARFAVRDGSTKNLTELVGLIFARLESKKTWTDRYIPDGKNPLTNLGVGLRFIPDETLRSFKDRHLKVASDPEIQEHAFGVLTQLHVHGQRAVPLLLSAIKNGLSGGKHFFRESRYQHPFLGGITGLCRAGPSASSAREPLLDLAKADKLPIHGSYGKLVATTLIRLGADTEEVWKIYSNVDSKNRTRKHYEKLVKRAESKRPNCHY